MSNKTSPYNVRRGMIPAIWQRASRTRTNGRTQDDRTIHQRLEDLTLGMLVLSRKIGERIIIGPSTEPVVIQLIETRGLSACIGITASKETIVDREEVAERRAVGKPQAKRQAS